MFNLTPNEQSEVKALTNLYGLIVTIIFAIIAIILVSLFWLAIILGWIFQFTLRKTLLKKYPNKYLEWALNNKFTRVIFGALIIALIYIIIQHIPSAKFYINYQFHKIFWFDLIR